MSNIGICEYVIGVIHDKDIWYYVGEYGTDGKKLEPRQKYSSFLADAKRYDDMDLLRDDLDLLHESVTRKIFEIQRCPKCGTIHKGNRDHHKHLYSCQCGYKSNDDRIGAMNIQFLGTMWISGNNNPRYERIITTSE